MGRLRTVCLTLYVVLCYFQAQGADKYTDENRPYEFGFTIDGEQHRHEKKDENGIIMGEFGFITADGVYHVTVYATDENGNFKIISMKNIRVKPYPTAPDTRGSTERKGHSLPFPSPSQQLSTPQVPAKTQNKQEPSSPLRSCSHCKLPTTTTSRPKSSSSAVLSTNSNYNKQSKTAENSQLSGSLQENAQKYNNQQVNSQYETSFAHQQSERPNLGQNYQQGPILGQSQQNIPRPGQTYPTQAVNTINQEQFLQDGLSQQNYPDDFNVGRQYLQKAQRQQGNKQPILGPNSLVQPNAGPNYQQGFNVEQQLQQGIIDGQYNLQPPYANQNEQPISVSSQSYPPQADARHDLSASKLGQNYPISNAEQKYVQGSNTRGNQYNQNKIYQNEPKNPNQAIDASVHGTIPGDREPKSFSDILQMVNPEQHTSKGTSSNSYAPSQQNIAKPVLVAAQMQVVDKNANIFNKNPGENDGLPKGLTKGDMTELLYTFNYTVGFHAHHEEGYRSGAKIGYYYVTGRNGIRTRVDYTADETGFHPRISQEVFNLQSEEVPKPESEKDEKYGLKGYEFKWLYYPIES